MSFANRIKKFCWFLILPFFRFIRRTPGFHYLITNPGRQPYFFGKLKNEIMPDDFLVYLKKTGFKPAYDAWIDKGEIISLRMLKDFEWQYHIRLFHDGEVRGHFERTPEAHPFGHFLDQGMNENKEEFLVLLSGWVDEIKA